MGVIDGSKRIGEVSKSYQGDKITLVKYEDALHVTVCFDDGAKKVCTYYDFKHGRVRSPHKVFDHYGNAYSTVEDMCKAYGLSLGAYKERRKSGDTLEEALSKKGRVYKREEITVDHLGNKYNSEAEMAEAYGLSPAFLHGRLAYMDVESALTKKKQERPEVYDHKGNKYPSFAAMCKEYGFGITTVKRRLSRGLTLKESLESSSRKLEFTDHKGRVFDCKEDAMRFYHINKNVYNWRISQGWSKEKALVTPYKKDTEKTRCRAERVGEKRTMNNGLAAEIVSYENNDHITVRFEDGEEKRMGYKEFLAGRAGHPTLKSGRNQKGSYAGFETKFIAHGYYKCRCTKCKYEDILTPQEMKKHVCTD